MIGARGLLPLLGLLALLVAVPARAEKKPMGPGERVDLNTATSAELMRLPGVGKKRAEAIVASRGKRPFKKAEEVTRVKGCSAAWYAKVKGMVTVGDVAAAPQAAPKPVPKTAAAATAR
ncbi:MAG: helix-hairpin-helix domain-containing protein [Deltaproteobacteria bacterium]